MFFIYRNEETIGPYTIEEVRRRLDQGEIGLDDFCWRDGMADWQLISETPIFSERPQAPARRRFKPAHVALHTPRPPPKVSPPAATEPGIDRGIGAMALILLGTIVAHYCVALYPAYVATGPSNQRALEVLLGQPLHIARLHDRLVGLSLGVALVIVGAFLLIQARRAATN